MERPAATQSLLVPLDGSALADHAIPYAAAIAAPDAAIVLFRVLVHEQGLDEVIERLGSRPEVSAATETTAREALETSAGLLGRRGEIKFATASGPPADTILAAIDEHHVGAVVIASHARGAIGRWMFGSVADRVARASPVPVLIVRPDHPDAPPLPIAFGRLLVPLDGSDTAMQALPVAELLAKHLRLPLHLLTAVNIASLVPVSVPGVAMPISGDLYDRIYSEARKAAQQTLDEAATPLRSSGLTVTTELRIGAAATEIVDACRQGDLVVLSSHGRSGVRRWLLGSVAEELVRSAPAPVLLVPVAGRQEAVSAAGRQD